MTAPAMLNAESLVVGYGGRPVLGGVSIKVHPNEILCVTGHNGAGKSTLIRSLFGLTRPSSGRILVDGKELASHIPRVLAANGIALMPEGRGIFPGLTVAEIFDLSLWSANIAKDQHGERIRPVANELDESERFPAELYAEMAALGLFGVAISETLGGAGGDAVSLIAVYNSRF